MRVVREIVTIFSDIKYDNVNDKLYMVFPNPFCMHGSLDQINADTGAVVSLDSSFVLPYISASTFLYSPLFLFFVLFHWFLYFLI